MDSILRDKSYIFAISIVKLAQSLQKDNKELIAMLVAAVKTLKSKLKK
jgi:hypothetical protein